MTIIFEVLFELIKRLYRFIGPAIFLLLILVIEMIAMPDIADSKAASNVRHLEANEILYFKEIGYDEEAGDRIFEVKLRNDSPDPSIFSSLYITDESGKSIFNSLKTEFEGLKIKGSYTMNAVIPPACESVAYVYIDDYKLEGIDHLYIRDVYSDGLKGSRFDIEKK